MVLAMRMEMNRNQRRTDRSVKSDVDRGPGRLRGPAVFLTKNLRHHETLASKNDNNSYKLLLYFYNIFLIIWPLNFFRVAHFDVRKAGSLTYGPEDRKICQSTPDRNPATVFST